MWFENSVFYQIYPLGYCGAERENDFGETRHRLSLLERDIPRLRSLGVRAVLFNPLFESMSHGYDTVDFRKIDRRLGTNEEFKALVNAFHAAGIRVVLDGVFNHVGRNFPPFQAVLKERENTDFRFWFNVDFSNNNRYLDGLSYQNWEGHDELVKLRLEDEGLQRYLMETVLFWIDEFQIDGLRLDVCYLLPPWFLELLRRTVQSKREDFFLVGEVIHIQNFAQNVSPARLDSITNYECFKGLISSVNSDNLNEIEYSLNRLFGPYEWCLYPGKQLLSFVDNHDVLRAYTAVKDKRKLLPLYTLLFSMPGIPCLYYGSEYGAEGDKSDNDYALRPPFARIDQAKAPALTEHIRALIRIRTEENALARGGYRRILAQNKIMAFARDADETVYVCLNISEREETMFLCEGEATDLLTGQRVSLAHIVLPPFSSAILK